MRNPLCLLPGRVVAGGEIQQFAVITKHVSAHAFADCDGVSRNRVENGLHVGRRAADDLEDLRGRGLPLERLLRLVEQAHVLDRDRGLVGEGLHQGDLTVREWPNLVSENHDHPQELSSLEHGDPKHGPDGVHMYCPIGVLGVGQDIMNVDRAPLEGGARRAGMASGSNGIPLDECSEFGGGVVRGHGSQKLTVEAEDERAFGRAQPDRVLGQRLEDRLEIERGAADHLEQLAGRRLPLERLLGLVEQAHVLDRDHRLVGEGLEQLDVPVGERSGLVRGDGDGPNELPIAEHRNREPASPASRQRVVARILRVGQHVGQIVDSPGQGGPAQHVLHGRPHREATRDDLQRLGREAVVGDRVQ